jgi:hypothetical protein
MQQKLHHITQKAKSALLGYPMVLAMAIIMASTIVFMTETDWKNEAYFWCIRLIITSALGISLMFALKMHAQRVGKELLWHALGLLFLVGFYFILPANEDDFSEMHLFIIVPTFILSHLMVAAIPFVGKETELSFWQYNKNLFINFFLTVIFTGVLTGGVELALVAIDQLFGMEFNGNIYGETFFVLAIIGSVFIFLLFNEKGLEALEKDGDYPVVLKFFTQFILIPLLLIYAVILYFYSAKILFKWELPEGWVSYLVLAYSIVGILALLLVHPLKGDSAKSWVKIFNKVFYFSLLPLIVLLFTAIFTRVLQYGFTEPRYFVLLLAVWLLGVVLYFIFMRRATIKFIPISLFLLGLFSLVFPYFNTFSVSVRSQKHELEQVLNTYKLLENGKINFDKPLPSDVAYDISDKFEYLSQRFEYDYLSSLIDKKALKNLTKKDTWYVDGLFTHKTEDARSKEAKNIYLTNSKRYAEVGDYQYIVNQNNLQGDNGIKINGDYFTLKNEVYKTEQAFVLQTNSKEQIDFMPKIQMFFKRYSGSNVRRETDSLFAEGDVGNYHVKVIFGYMSQTTYEGREDYYFSDAVFLIRRR